MERPNLKAFQRLHAYEEDVGVNVKIQASSSKASLNRLMLLSLNPFQVQLDYSDDLVVVIHSRGHGVLLLYSGMARYSQARQRRSTAKIR